MNEQDYLELGSRTTGCLARENAATPTSPWPDLLGFWAVQRRGQDAALLGNRKAWAEYRVRVYGFDSCSPYALDRQV